MVIAARAGTPLAEVDAHARRARARSCPSSRSTTAPLLGSDGRADHRRRRGGEPLRAAPHHGGRGARQPDRRALRQRARRGGEIRRAGDEERHRARPRQAHGRLLGHARLPHRGHLQGAAAARARRDPRPLPASTTPAPSRRSARRSPRPSRSTGAAHLPAGLDGEGARTLIRIEGFSSSVDYRLGELRRLLKPFGAAEILEGDAAAALWRGVRDADAPRRAARPRPSGASRPRRRKGPAVAAAIARVRPVALVLRLGRRPPLARHRRRGRRRRGGDPRRRARRRRPRHPGARPAGGARRRRRVRAAGRAGDARHGRDQGGLRPGGHSQSGAHVCRRLRSARPGSRRPRGEPAADRRGAASRPRRRSRRRRGPDPSRDGARADLHLRHRQALARRGAERRELAAPRRLVHALAPHPRLPVLRRARAFWPAHRLEPLARPPARPRHRSSRAPGRSPRTPTR